MTEMTVGDSSNAHWTLDRRVPVALILSIVLQSAGLFMWVGALTSRVSELETKAVRSIDAGDRVISLEAEMREVRRTPITLSAPSEVEIRVTLTMPEEWTHSELPPPASESWDGGQVELSGSPVADLHQTCREVNSHLAQVRAGVKAGVILPVGLSVAGAWQRENASQLDQTCGDVVTININGGHRPVPMMAEAKSMSDTVSSVGEREIRASVSATFELD